MRVSPRILLALLAVSASPQDRGSAADAGAGRFAYGAGYPAESAHSVALHMHGSMSEQSGSWEWHVAKAESLGVDVIWWTDHDWRLSNERAMKKYDFESAFWDAAGSRWKEPDDGFPGEFRYFEVSAATSGSLLTAVVDTMAYQGARSFRLAVAGEPGGAFRGGLVTQTCSDFQNHYSLAKHPKLRFRVRPEALDAADACFVFEVELSDHPEETPVLRYVLGAPDVAGEDAFPLAFTPGVWNEYVVDVTADAISRFSSGGADTLRVLDNTVAFVRLGVFCRHSSDAVVFFDEYRIEPAPALVGDVLVSRAREIAAHYESLTPAVANFVGSEISKFRAQPHLNAYAPGLALVDYTGRIWSDSLYYAIDQIHAQGGAVSLNHLFGPQFLYENNPNETPAQRDARRLWTKRAYVGNRALGVDVLEVGYRARGGCDLSHHLDLWDVLNANMVFVTGNGVTDSHGRGPYQLDGWGPAELGLSTTNNFVTWLHTEEFSEAGFVQAMKSGRAFFGDPYRWQGTLDVVTMDAFRMGQVVLTDRDEHELLVEITNFPAGAQVRLLQAEMRDDPPQEYLTPQWIRDEWLTGEVSGGAFVDTFAVATTTPSFVRVELRDALGREIAFANPLHFVRTVPAAGVAAERAAARLGPVRLFRAEDLRLLAADWDGNANVLHLELEEDAAGLGRLRLDPGALGAPTGVAGAEAWSMTGGIVELNGFPGAVVDVSWGPTSVAARPAAAALSLSTGRPNPFAGHAAFDYVLPREGWVRIDVVDVGGRRVRTLVLASRRAGAHRVTWDGADEWGRPVAAGVYAVRLEHDGRTITRKTLRLR